MSIEEIKESIAKAVESCGDELVAWAEKRAMSRAVLKLAGLYKFNVYGEDEVDTKDPGQ